MGTKQVYELTVQGHHHRVETSTGEGWSSEATWWVDDEQVATEKSATDEVLHLAVGAEHDLAAVAGAVRVQFTVLGKPVRATLFEGERSAAIAASYIGTGGIDLVPEAGSPAARREERMRAHPRLHAARHVVGGVGKVVVPIVAAAVAAWLLSRVTWPVIDLPDLPWPDLPAIPWPDLPSWDLPAIPWPDLPSWGLPGWVRRLLDHVKYVWPVLLGLWLAGREVRRRREQDELRARMTATGSSATAADGSPTGDVPADEPEGARDEEDETADARDE